MSESITDQSPPAPPCALPPAPPGVEMLRARGLCRTYATSPWRRGRGASGCPALNQVDLDVRAGQRLAVVGASGSGKSTLARLLLALEPMDRGSLQLRGRPVQVGAGGLRWYRRAVQLVPQDPSSSLNPAISVGRSVAEPIVCLGLPAGRDRRRLTARVSELLQQVGLGAEVAARRPHEFSGGQRQRIALARALAAEPELVVADEPVTALDVAARLEVLALLRRLSEERGLAVVMVCHDLGVAQFLCEDVVVLAGGRVVDRGPTSAVFASPGSEATRALVAAAPRLTL